MIDATPSLDQLSPQQLREMVSRLMGEVRLKQVTIDKLAHEMAVLKRLKFAARSEAFRAQQHSLLEETIDTDLEALAQEIEQLAPPSAPGPREKQQPKRQSLPSVPGSAIQHSSWYCRALGTISLCTAFAQRSGTGLPNRQHFPARYARQR